MGEISKYEIPGYSAPDVGINVARVNRELLKSKERSTLQFTGAYIDLVGECGFNCNYCFKHMNEERPQERHEEPLKRLNFEQIQGIIDFVKERNGQTITFAGEGEPTRDPDFDMILDYIKKEGLESVIFTNGERITELRAKKMLETGSVLVKRDTLDDELQNEISQTPWASTVLRDATELLLNTREELDRAGQKHGELGIDSPITRQNVHGLPDLLRYCRKNNIIPYFEAFIELGQDKGKVNDLSLTREELTKIFLELQRIDKEEFSIDTPVVAGMRTYGQPACARGSHMFAVKTSGDIFPCISAIDEEKKIGNISDGLNVRESLGDAFDVKKHPDLRFKMTCSGCSKTVGSPRRCAS